MGSFSSKFLKSNCTDVPDAKNMSNDRIQIPDPRSPTGEIMRTPITITEHNITGENVHNNVLELKPSLMKQTVLKNMKFDPRSPTDGISRTPLFLDNTPVQASNQHYSQYESPLSIYSHDFSNIGSLNSIMTPSEPSVNVSGFDNNDNSSSRDLDHSLRDNVNEIEYGIREQQSEETPVNNTRTPLKVSSKPSTTKAKKMLTEIFTSKDFEHEYVSDVKKLNKIVKNNTHNVHCDNYDSKINSKRKEKLKYRTPLSNITLSNNSPNNVNVKNMKPYARCKIMSDTGLENSESPRRQIAEWDKEKTVII